MPAAHLCHEADGRCAGGRACEHRRCCNPAHLQPVTLRENLSRGRGGTRTHCQHGHEFTPDNTYLTPDGNRQCRECNRQRARANYARRRDT